MILGTIKEDKYNTLDEAFRSTLIHHIDIWTVVGGFGNVPISTQSRPQSFQNSGKGGGKADMAQGGGSDASALDAALASVPDKLSPVG